MLLLALNACVIMALFFVFTDQDTADDTSTQKSMLGIVLMIMAIILINKTLAKTWGIYSMLPVIGVALLVFWLVFQLRPVKAAIAGVIYAVYKIVEAVLIHWLSG